MNSKALQRAREWTTIDYDEETRKVVNGLIKENSPEIEECFSRELEFGTGGLRGIMGIGTFRMNDYTVGYASQGLADYIMANKENDRSPSMAIAYDSRNNSEKFARRTAEIMAANGIKAYIFSELRPTPMLSFAVRELGCIAGVVITASHNPKEYNGYKVYWSDGGQLVPPHDKGVIDKVRRVSSPKDIRTHYDASDIIYLDDEMDAAYLGACKQLLRLPTSFASKQELVICYTSIHGTGITMIPRALAGAGFTNVHLVEEQSEANGDFPTVVSPNPEERSAMSIGLEKSEAIGADVLFGTDPDTDRVGMAVRNDNGELVLLNGNETASLLVEFLLNTESEGNSDRLPGFIAKTIVTSEVLRSMADRHGIPIHDTLTGFKYIAELIRKEEGKSRFIGGGEESYGYLIGDLVRDKDAVISTVILAEMAAWAMEQGLSVYGLLKRIRTDYGFYKESLVSLVRKGLAGASEIKQLMTDLRQDPPKSIAGSPVVKIIDHDSGRISNIRDGSEKSTGLPSSNVLQFFLEDGSKITARPSGTEPKIKYYLSVNSTLESLADHDRVSDHLEARLVELKEALGLQT